MTIVKTIEVGICDTCKNFDPEDGCTQTIPDDIDLDKEHCPLWQPDILYCPHHHVFFRTYCDYCFNEAIKKLKSRGGENHA